MALTRIGLAISLTTNSACNDVALTDTTGIYPTVSTGYGMPSGATINSVTNVIITVNISGGTYITYTMVVTSGVITSCLVSINGGTGTEIVTKLTSTTFPLTGFSLFSTAYGVTLPTLEDCVLEVDYNIIGVIKGDPTSAFNYLTSASNLISCDLCCCLQKKALSIDLNCGCSEDSMLKYLLNATYLDIAAMQMDIGNTANATIALNKAIDMCSEDCDCNC